MDGCMRGWVDISSSITSHPWALGLPLGCSDLPPLALILSRQLWGLPQDWAGVALSCLPLRLDKQKSLFSLPCLVPLQPRAGSCWQVSWQVSCCNLILRLNLSSWALGLSGSTVELGMMGVCGGGTVAKTQR